MHVVWIDMMERNHSVTSHMWQQCLIRQVTSIIIINIKKYNYSMPILLFGFRVLFLPVDMLIAFCWMTSMFQILSMRHSRPPIHWKRSKIRREEGEEKRLSHTPTEWWILFGLCLLSPCLAQLDCYVGFYGEKQRPCQTPSSTRNEKKEKQVQRWDEEGDAAGAKRETWFQEFRGCGLAGSKTQQTERAMQCEKKKTKNRK